MPDKYSQAVDNAMRGKFIPHKKETKAILNEMLENVQLIVRCNDCKWYKKSGLLAPNKFCFRLKDRKGDIAGYNFTPDGFCSYGERKDE